LEREDEAGSDPRSVVAAQGVSLAHAEVGAGWNETGRDHLKASHVLI